jgi:hypothetical protein
MSVLVCESRISLMMVVAGMCTSCIEYSARGSEYSQRLSQEARQDRGWVGPTGEGQKVSERPAQATGTEPQEIQTVD